MLGRAPCELCHCHNAISRTDLDAGVVCTEVRDVSESVSCEQGTKFVHFPAAHHEVILADVFAVVSDQLVPLRQCENFIRDGKIEEAARAASSGVAAYPRAVPARPAKWQIVTKPTNATSLLIRLRGRRRVR